MTDQTHPDAGAQGFIGADIHLTRKGYTLTLWRREGPLEILGGNGREPKCWHKLDHALAFLAEHYGVISPVRLKLRE